MSLPLPRNVSLALILAASFLALQTLACRRLPPPQLYLVEEAYRVYSAILPPTDHLLIRRRTSTHDFCLYPLDDQAKQVLSSPIHDYQELNEERWLLDRKLDSSRNYDWLTEEDLTADFPKGTSGMSSMPGWNLFRVRHPGAEGWIELSAVGFNPDQTIAVVYMEYHCGAECAGGEFRALQKVNGNWQLLTGRGKWNRCTWRNEEHSA